MDRKLSRQIREPRRSHRQERLEWGQRGKRELATAVEIEVVEGSVRGGDNELLPEVGTRLIVNASPITGEAPVTVVTVRLARR